MCICILALLLLFVVVRGINIFLDSIIYGRYISLGEKYIFEFSTTGSCTLTTGGISYKGHYSKDNVYKYDYEIKMSNESNFDALWVSKKNNDIVVNGGSTEIWFNDDTFLRR